MLAQTKATVLKTLRPKLPSPQMERPLTMGQRVRKSPPADAVAAVVAAAGAAMGTQRKLQRKHRRNLLKMRKLPHQARRPHLLYRSRQLASPRRVLRALP